MKTPTEFLEQFCNEPYKIKPGKYKIQATLPTSHAGVKIVWGQDLSSSKYVFIYPEIAANPVEIEVEEENCSLWMLTFLTPSSNLGSRLEFGEGAGENNFDIVTIDVVGDANAAPAYSELSTFPSRDLVNLSWCSPVLDALQLKNYDSAVCRRVEVLHGSVPAAEKIEIGTTVFLFSPGGFEIYGVWDGITHKTPQSFPFDKSGGWRFCALVKSSTPKVIGSDVTFDFSVGDPRKEATVTVSEEEG